MSTTIKTLQMLRYTKGKLYWPYQKDVDPTEAPPQVIIPVSVLSYEKGELLLNVEGSEQEAITDREGFLDLVAKGLLYRITCRVTGTSSTATHLRILHTAVDDIETIQRRQERRFPLRVFTVIRLLTEEEWRRRRGLLPLGEQRAAKFREPGSDQGDGEENAPTTDPLVSTDSEEDQARDEPANQQAEQPEDSDGDREDTTGNSHDADDASPVTDESPPEKGEADRESDIVSGGTVDVSRSGLRVVSDSELEEGTRVELRFQLGGEPMRAEGRIVRRRPIPGGQVIYGVRFTSLALVDERRLARFVLQRERRERQQEQQATERRSAAAARPDMPSRSERRDRRPRWQRRRG